MSETFDLSDDEEYREACEAIGGEMTEYRYQGAPGTGMACHVEMQEVRNGEISHGFLWDSMMDSGPVFEVVGEPPYDEGSPVQVSGPVTVQLGDFDDSEVEIDRMNEHEATIHGSNGNVSILAKEEFDDVFKYR